MALRRPRLRLFGYYVHKQWSHDSAQLANLTYQIQIASTTITYRDSLRYAMFVEDRLDDLDCLSYILDICGFAAIEFAMHALTNPPMVSVDRLPRSRLRVHEQLGEPVFPVVKTVIRIYHRRGNAIIRGPYEYELVYNALTCDCISSEVGRGRPGRPPKKQTTLGEFA